MGAPKIRIDGSRPSIAIEEISQVTQQTAQGTQERDAAEKVRLPMSSQGNQLVRLFHVEPADGFRASRLDVRRFDLAGIECTAYMSHSEFVEHRADR
jgi:hypothetical protein